MKREDKEKQKKIKKLVIARLITIPSNVRISVGSKGHFNKEELIKQINSDTDIGKKMIEMELGYLKKLKEGIFYVQGNSNY